MSGSWRDAYRETGREWQGVVFRPSRVPLVEVWRTEIEAIRSGRWSYSDAAMLAGHAVLDDDDEVPLNYGRRAAGRWPAHVEQQREIVAQTEGEIAVVEARAARIRDAARIPNDVARKASMLRDAEAEDAHAADGRDLLAARRNTLKIMEIADREQLYVGSDSETPTDRDRAYRLRAADCLRESLKRPLRTLERELSAVERANPDATDLELAEMVGETVAELLDGLTQHAESHDDDAHTQGLGGTAARMRELVTSGLKAAHGESGGQGALFPGVVVDPDVAWCFWWAYVAQDPKLDHPHSRQSVLGGRGPRKWLYYLCHVVWYSKARETYIQNRDKGAAMLSDTLSGVVGMTQRSGPGGDDFTAELRLDGQMVSAHNQGRLLGWLNVETVQRAAKHRKAICSAMVLDSLLWCVDDVQRRGLTTGSTATDLSIPGSWGKLLEDVGYANTPGNRAKLRDGFRALATVHLRSDAGETIGLLTVKTHETGKGRPAPGRKAALDIRLGFDLAPTPQMLAARGANFAPLVERPPLFTTNKKHRFRERLLFLDTTRLLRDAWKAPVTGAEILQLAAEHGLPEGQAEIVLQGWTGSWLESSGGVFRLADPSAQKVLNAGHSRSLESSRRGRKRKAREKA